MSLSVASGNFHKYEFSTYTYTAIRNFTDVHDNASSIIHSLHSSCKSNIQWDVNNM